MDNAASTSINFLRFSFILDMFFLDIVGWSSSSIRRHSELPKVRVLLPFLVIHVHHTLLHFTTCSFPQRRNLVKIAKYRYIFAEDTSKSADVREAKVSRGRISEMEGFSHSLYSALPITSHFIFYLSSALQFKIHILFFCLKIIEAMIQGLTRLSWERIDVDFSTSIQGPLAHTTILASNQTLSCDRVTYIVS